MSNGETCTPIKTQKRLDILYQTYAFNMVEPGGLEPPYTTISNILSTRLVYPESSLALSEQTNQRLTTLYYIHQFFLE